MIQPRQGRMRVAHCASGGYAVPQNDPAPVGAFEPCSRLTNHGSRITNHDSRFTIDRSPGREGGSLPSRSQRGGRPRRFPLPRARISSVTIAWFSNSRSWWSAFNTACTSMMTFPSNEKTTTDTGPLKWYCRFHGLGPWWRKASAEGVTSVGAATILPLSRPSCAYFSRIQQNFLMAKGGSIGSVVERMLLRVAGRPSCRLPKLEWLTRGRHPRIATEKQFPTERSRRRSFLSRSPSGPKSSPFRRLARI